jgi:hypothetical protein
VGKVEEEVMKMWDYTCPDGHETKDVLTNDTEKPSEEVECEHPAGTGKCGKMAKLDRVYATPGVRLPMGPATFSRGH